MIWLLAACLLWGPSFSLVARLIHDHNLNPYTLALLRMGCSLLLFLPLLRVRGTDRRLRLSLTALGGLQFGVMYMALFNANRFLYPHEVALVTIFTPLYVSGLHHWLSRGRPDVRSLFCVVLAVAGAGVMRYARPSGGADYWTGFLIMQVSNLAFAAGQVGYRKLLRGSRGLTDAPLFGWMYLGAVLVTLAGWLTMTQSAAELTKLTALPPAAWGLVLFLGFIPSGLAFFLFNHGALKVDPASLAIVNNLKIPLAVVLTLLVFGDLAGIQDPLRFGMGSLLMLGALLWNEARARSPAL